MPIDPVTGLDMPTREQFIEAAIETFDMSPEDAGRMYDLLVGPPEPFMAALTEWAEANPPRGDRE